MIRHLPLILTASVLFAGLAGQWYLTGYRLDECETALAGKADAARIAELATALATEATSRHEVYCYASRLHGIDPPPPGCPR